MNTIITKISIIGLTAMIASSVYAGGQGGRRIFDSIAIVNDTDGNVLINQDRILKPGETVGIKQETLDKQTKKIVDIYLINKKQPLTWSYYTYGKVEGTTEERMDGIRVKVSELLKDRRARL